MRHFLLALLLAMSGMGLMSGCESEDQQAVRLCYETFTQACQDRNGDVIVTMMTPETIAHFDTLLGLARRGTGSEIRRLPVQDRYDVLYLRLTVSDDLKAKLDGRELVRLLVNGGLWRRERGFEPLGEIKIRGDAATGVVQRANKSMRFKMDFRRIDREWTMDFLRFRDDMNRLIESRASDLEIDVEALFDNLLYEQTGRVPRDDLYDRP